MHIEVKISDELTVNDWKTYTYSFNQVFQKSFTVKDFEHKYLNTIDTYSYHVLLKDDKNDVVGGFTAIPYEYLIANGSVRVGVIVDVFITEDHRSDLLALHKMYKKIKEELIENDIALTITNPNETAFKYWQKIVRMKEVGNLYYHILPLKIANVVTKLPKFLNSFSLFGSKLFAWLSIFNVSERLFPIRLNRFNDIIEKQRYTKDHKKISIKNTFFTYRIVNEEGVITCYLIDFYNIKNRKKDTTSLRRAISYIISVEDIDLIIFVGKLTFFQFLLFKVPFKLEPRHLHFMVDIINKEKVSNPEIIYNFHNWDFGLFNYDVR